MSTQEPDVTLTGRYTPKETCALLGISRQTLHTRTQAGIIKAGIRKADNRKFYTGAEIRRHWMAQF